MFQSFKSKLFITFVIYGLILIFITQFAVLKISEGDIKSVSILKASQKFLERDRFLKNYTRDVKSKLLSVKNSKIFKSYIQDNNNISLANNLFLDIVNSSKNIMQLRFIDNQGFEKIRIDRISYTSKANIIINSKFQNKSNRYYFKEINDIKKGEFWYSKFDLNMEYGKIEDPIKPVFRIGTPVYNNDKKIGILIINVFMEEFLNEFINTPLFNTYLIDKDGYILKHPDYDFCWSRYKKNKTKISDFFQNDYKYILDNDEYIGDDFYSKKISLNNNEDIRIILKLKEHLIQEDVDKHFYQLLWIMIAVVLLSFPISYFLSIRPSKMKEDVDNKIDIKTKELHELNVLLSLFDLSDAVLFKWNNDSRWSVASVSKSVNKLIGYSQGDFQENKIVYANCIHHDDIQRVTDEVRNAIERKKYFFTHAPYRIVTKDSKIKWILDNTVIVRDKKDKIINFVGYLTDITQLKDSELKLKYLSITDQLTKIYNRVHIDELLYNQHYRFTRNQEELSVIIVDIDFFKAVNDEYGHLTGDKVLIEFASLLKSSIRSGDTVGRWGGEEFLVILPHTNLKQAMYLAKKLQLIIQENNFSKIKYITASFGVAALTKNMTIEALIDTADKALYLSKESGRNSASTIQDIK